MMESLEQIKLQETERDIIYKKKVNLPRKYGYPKCVCNKQQWYKIYEAKSNRTSPQLIFFNIKIDSSWEPAVQHRELSSVLRDNLEG